MFCSKCGTKIPDEAAFCRSCGAPMRGPRPNPKPPLPHSGAMPKETEPAAAPSATASQHGPAAREGIPLKPPIKEPVPAAQGEPDSIQHTIDHAKQAPVPPAGTDPLPGNQVAKPAEARPLQTPPVSAGGKAPLDPAQQARHYRRIGIMAVSAAALVVIAGITALCIFLFGGTSYQKAIDNMMKATLDADAKAAYAMFPKAYQQKLLKEEGYANEREAIEDIANELENTKTGLDNLLGKGWQYSYKILSVENRSSRELRELKEEYLDDYDIQIDGAMEAEVEFAIRCEQGNQSSTLDVPLMKIGRSWYIDFANASNMINDILRG